MAVTVKNSLSSICSTALSCSDLASAVQHLKRGHSVNYHKKSKEMWRQIITII